MFNWLWKRIFSDDNVGYLIQKGSPMIKEQIGELTREAIIDMMHDEAFLEQITGLGDALFDRYKKKFFSTIGGMQKGINYAVADANPLAQIIDKDGNISLAGIVKGFLSGGLNLPKGGDSGPSFTKSTRKALKYQ